MTEPLFLLDPKITHLNHGAFGACPRPVLDHQSELRARIERDPTQFFVHELEPLLDEVRSVVADLVGAHPDDIALVTNATHGTNVVLASIDLSPGDEVLFTSHGYNAVNNAALRWAARAGAHARAVVVPFPIAGPEAVVDAVASALGPKTKLVVVDHVTSPSALVLPVREIVAACRARGVEVLVDAAHAPGMVPMALDAIGAGYTTGNLHKWICAPRGAAFLHVRSDLRDRVQPLVTSHGRSSPRTDRSRFLLEFDWTGTDDPTALLAVPRAIETVSALDEGGLPGVMRENRELVLAARTLVASRLGLTVPCPDAMIGSMAALLLPDDPDCPADRLWRRLHDVHRIQAVVFGFPTAERRTLRISAQRYNRIAEYERLADVLGQELADVLD